MRREIRLLDEIDAFADGDELSHAVAFTYGYDGDWVRERLWQPLMEKFGVAHPLVFTDGNATEAGNALNVHVVRMRRRFGLFHPKLLLAIRHDGAALLTVGSANLTKGGLGGQLELATALRFGQKVTAPPDVLREACAFIERLAAAAPMDRTTRDVLAECLRLARAAADETPELARGPRPSFLTSLDRPLWEQILEHHEGDPLDRLVVVSPFLEQEREVPDPDSSLLANVLDGQVAWAPRPARPRILLHTGEPNGMFLPVAFLRARGRDVQHRIQKLSVEPRRLHCKLFALLGRKRTTLVWGSANFTPAALLRATATGGNVECVLALSVPRAQLDEAGLIETFDLEELFAPHVGELPEAIVRACPPPALFDVQEVMYDPAARTLALYATVFSDVVRRLRVSIAGTDVLETTDINDGKVEVERPAPGLEVPDDQTGKPTLADLSAVVVALDEAGNELERVRLRINVRFDDARELAENLLLGKNAASPDALLLPAAGGPEARWQAVEALIAGWRAERSGGVGRPSGHQATLDLFFHRVRRGTDLRLSQLEACRGRLAALARWSREIRRAFESAAASEYPAVRRTYFVDRVSGHVESVLKRLPAWTDGRGAAQAALEPGRLAAALRAVQLPAETLVEPAQQAERARARVLELLEKMP